MTLVEETNDTSYTVARTRNIRCVSDSTLTQRESESEKIMIERGVRQRDTISPMLFTSRMDGQFRRLNWENKDVMIDG